jgi:hypothetical protein
MRAIARRNFPQAARMGVAMIDVLVGFDGTGAPCSELSTPSEV